MRNLLLLKVLFAATLTCLSADALKVTSKAAKELLKHPEFKKALEAAPEFTKAVLKELDKHAPADLREPTKAEKKKFAETLAKAINGNADAQFNLAYFYRHGLGPNSKIQIPHSEDPWARFFMLNRTAAEWRLKAAEQGHTRAQWYIASMIEYGVAGLEKDFVTAYAWYKISASNGYVASKWAILDPLNDAERESTANLIEISKPTAEKMTPAQIAKGKALAQEMIKKNPRLIH